MADGNREKGAAHSLSDTAIAMLRRLRDQGPLPRQEINPGLARRLVQDLLVDSVDLPSPYKTHRGHAIEHFQINATGLSAISR